MLLIQQLASVEFLEYEAWASLNKSNPESYGLSEETVARFRSEIHSRLHSIKDQLLKDGYKFSSTRAAVIPKDNNKSRPLQIPEIQDRVVLKGLAIILEQQLKPVLKSSEGYSFAYQKKLGVRDAVMKMKDYYDKGYNYVLEADIINFFPTVDRKSLLTELFKLLPDDSLNKLIEEGISQPVGGLEKIKQNDRGLFDVDNKNGIPQGNPLSPLFSNLYLAPFDTAMKEKGLALIRYADDFIIMCKDMDSAHLAYTQSRDYLENILLLKVHELGTGSASKTRIVQPTKDHFSFLSVAFDGKKLFPSRKGVNKFLENIIKICKGETGTFNVYQVLFRLKFSVEGWVSIYFYTDIERYFEEVETIINQQLSIALKRMGWKLSSGSLGKVKAAYRRQLQSQLDSGDCLSDTQRKYSGVPLCSYILKQRRKEETDKSVVTKSGNSTLNLKQTTPSNK